MIYIKEDSPTVIKFGYGDVSIKILPLSNSIFFQNIKPSLHKCRLSVTKKSEFIRDNIVININYKTYDKFTKLIDRVGNKEIDSFEFNSIIFDFSKCDFSSICTFKAFIHNTLMTKSNFVSSMIC